MTVIVGNKEMPYLVANQTNDIMYITDDKSLRQVKLEFQDKFPWLKLEFYNNSHEVGKASSEDDHLDDDKTIGEVRKVHTEGELSIHGNLKVASLEEEFKDGYGLNVQVFRRSGEIWLQTTSTDDWTLTEQNDKGANSGSTGGVVESYEVD
ncbi:MAG: hypothetical protein KA479_12190 [Saprospiraceae bacterium]|nr:hypothetical protein [Saprospiraceae bacterium]